MPTAELTPIAAAMRSLRRASAQARGWGGPGALGLACLIATLGVSAIWVPALQRRADDLASDADAAESRVRRLDSQRRTQASAVPAPQRFVDAFPSARGRQERLAALVASATEHQLEPRRVELRLGPEAGLGLMRYSVSMPLTGSYAQLREFVEQAQARDPTLGLDRMRLRRASANTGAVEIELGWSLFMQAEPRPDAPAPVVRSASR